MFEKTTVHELFPTPVWVVDLSADVHQPLNRKIIEAVGALAANRPTIRPGETWQTDPYIHRLPQFADVATVIRAGAKGALDFLQVEYGAFEITGCWVNINPKGGLNTRHTHPNNFLSGTYYVQVPEGANRIVFDDPRPQAMAMLPRTRRYSKFIGRSASRSRPAASCCFRPGCRTACPPIPISSSASPSASTSCSPPSRRR